MGGNGQWHLHMQRMMAERPDFHRRRGADYTPYLKMTNRSSPSRGRVGGMKNRSRVVVWLPGYRRRRDFKLHMVVGLNQWCQVGNRRQHRIQVRLWAKQNKYRLQPIVIRTGSHKQIPFIAGKRQISLCSILFPPLYGIPA